MKSPMFLITPFTTLVCERSLLSKTHSKKYPIENGSTKNISNEIITGGRNIQIYQGSFLFFLPMLHKKYAELMPNHKIIPAKTKIIFIVASPS